MYATPRLALIALVLIAGSSPTTAIATSASDARGGAARDLVLTGSLVVDAVPAVLSRVAGIGDGASVYGATLSIHWPDARLTGEGMPALPVRLDLALTLGHAMPVGVHTAYPGLITALEDARGTLVNLATGFTVNIRLSHQGTWIGKFIHSESASASSGHVALELPFTLHDVTTDAILAENCMIVRLDASRVRESIAGRALISPTPFPELRRATTDIGGVLEQRFEAPQQSSMARARKYELSFSRSIVRGIGGRDPFKDLFSTDGLALYESDFSEWLSIELESQGLSPANDEETALLSLHLRFLPGLIHADSRSAWFEQVAGEIEIQHAQGIERLRITPGNHDLHASRVHAIEDGVRFDFAVALHPAGGSPSLARLTMDCSSKTATCGRATLTSSLALDRPGLSRGPSAPRQPSRG